MISLGWGHRLPMDDYLNSPKGVVKLESYVLYDPEHKALNIPFQNPGILNQKEVVSLSGASVRTGEIFDRKIKFSADMKPGTWQVAAAQEWDFVQAYKDKKGRLVIVRKPLSEVKETKAILF